MRIKIIEMGSRMSLASRSIDRIARKLARTPASDSLFKMDLALNKGQVHLPSLSESAARLSRLYVPPKPQIFPSGWKYLHRESLDLTVIVPAYNVEQYIGGCIDSIRRQRFDISYEIIAINDGSTDGTEGLLCDLAKSVSALRVINQPNSGLSAARNTGISEARGRFILFVDSDDELPPDAFGILVPAIRSSGADAVLGNWGRMSLDGRILGPGETARTHGAPWGAIYKRSVWDDIRFPRGFWFEDTVMGYCILPRINYMIISDCVYHYRVNPKGIAHSASSSLKSLDSYYVVEEMLRWRRHFGMPLDQAAYDRTIRQLGPLLVSRTACLSVNSMVDLFALCSGLMKALHAESGLRTQMEGRWSYVEDSLLAGDYLAWRSACRWAV